MTMKPSLPLDLSTEEMLSTSLDMEVTIKTVITKNCPVQTKRSKIKTSYVKEYYHSCQEIAIYKLIDEETKHLLPSRV